MARKTGGRKTATKLWAKNKKLYFKRRGSKSIPRSKHVRLMTQYFLLYCRIPVTHCGLCTLPLKTSRPKKRLTVNDSKSDKIYCRRVDSSATCNMFLVGGKERKELYWKRHTLTFSPFFFFGVCTLTTPVTARLQAVWGHKIAVIYCRQMHRTYQKYGSEMLRGNKVAGTPAWLPLSRGTPRKHENLAESDEKERCRGTAEILPESCCERPLALCRRSVNLLNVGGWRARH